MFTLLLEAILADAPRLDTSDPDHPDHPGCRLLLAYPVTRRDRAGIWATDTTATIEIDCWDALAGRAATLRPGQRVIADLRDDLTPSPDTARQVLLRVTVYDITPATTPTARTLA